MDLCDILSELVNECHLPESKARERENGGKNLLCFHENLIFMWDQNQMQIILIQMHFHTDSKKKYHLERYICSQPPDCEIREIRYLEKRECLLLIGNLSVTVVFCTLPRLNDLHGQQQQKPDKFLMWRSCLISSTISNGNINIKIVSVITSRVESNLVCILTSDNMIRFFDLDEKNCHSVHNFFIQAPMHGKIKGRRKRSIGRSIVGESAIAIDFIPTNPPRDSTYTFDSESSVNSEFMIALMESGDVLLYIILYDLNFGVKNYCLGYLRVFPSSNSSHILSANSMIVVYNTQTFVAISCSTGHIFHCLLLFPSSSYIHKSIEMNDQIPEDQSKSLDHGVCLDPLAGLYVIENISIGSGSIDNNDDKEFKNDEPNSLYLLNGGHPYSCYYYVRQNANLYCIYVSWFEKMLLEYFEGGEDYDSVFQNESIMSTLVEDPYHHSQHNHVVGICSVYHSLVGVFSLVLLNTGKLSVFSNIVPFLEPGDIDDTDSKSVTNNNEDSTLPTSEKTLQKSPNFLQKIQKILATRQRNLPMIIGSSGHENSQFDLKSAYSEVLDIIFKDYIKRCELARCEIDKKMSFIEISIRNNTDLLEKSFAACVELQKNLKGALQRSEEIESQLSCSMAQFLKLQNRICHSFPSSPEELKLKELCTSVRSQLNHVSDLIFNIKAKKKCIEMLNVTPTEISEGSSTSTVGLTRVPSRKIEESPGLSSSQLISIRSHLEDNSKKIKKLLSDYEKLKARADLK